jgi:hypothetical protein
MQTSPQYKRCEDVWCNLLCAAASLQCSAAPAVVLQPGSVPEIRGSVLFGVGGRAVRAHDVAAPRAHWPQATPRGLEASSIGPHIENARAGYPALQGEKDRGLGLGLRHTPKAVHGGGSPAGAATASEAASRAPRPF